MEFYDSESKLDSNCILLAFHKAIFQNGHSLRGLELLYSC